MSTHGHRLLRSSGQSRVRWTPGIAFVTAALTVASLGAAPTASSADDPDCPEAFPTANLDPEQPVRGLTVSTGTKPEKFKGEVLGVIENGIALDLDMIVMRLTSTEIDRVGGIWSGMSGSPVYADDGRLIGAVSYGLSMGSSPVAGVTPAADMQALLAASPTDSVARGRLRAANAKDRVTIPRSMRRDLVSSGAAARNEVDGGLSRLLIPLGISGMSSNARLRYAARTLDMDGVKVYRAGAVSASAEAAEIVPGGNLAASLSYGDVSAVGVGTATAVCGGEALAFGHPMILSGRSTLTMHGADAVYIQEDTLGAPFKVANASPPVGGIVQDRLAAIVGRVGASSVPKTTEVTSHVAVTGEASRRGRTSISVPAAVPDIATFHLLANQDRVSDAVAGGSSRVSWKVSGNRANGRAFSYTRSDRYADKFDTSLISALDVFDQLSRLQNNDFEAVRITNIHERALLSRDFKAFTIKKVAARARGRWTPLRSDRVLPVRAGTTKHFRVTLTSAQAPTRKVRLKVRVPAGAAGKSGYLEILGGNSFFGEGGGEEGVASSSAKSFDQLLRQLAREPRNDDVLVSLNFLRNNGSVLKSSARKRATAVVDGGTTVEIRGLRR